MDARTDTIGYFKTRKWLLGATPDKGKQVQYVYCFLDEGSDTSYVNEDVVEELGLDVRKLGKCNYQCC